MGEQVHCRNPNGIRQTHYDSKQRRQPESEEHGSDRNELEHARHTAQDDDLRRHDIKAAPQMIGVMDQPAGQVQRGRGGQKTSTWLPWTASSTRHVALLVLDLFGY